MGQHVFICYSSKDTAQATSVSELLERNGIACWMAHRNIQPGVSWTTAIVDAIDNVSLMLVLISTSANSSRHVARDLATPSAHSADVRTIVSSVGRTDKKSWLKECISWLADNTKTTIAGVGIIIVTMTGVVSQAKSLRDGVCSLYAFSFCDGGDSASRQEKDEMDRLASAKFDEGELRTLARDAKTPGVREKAQHRLDVVATEKNSYEAVKNDKASLTEFLKKPCEACLLQSSARTQLQTLNDQDEGIQNAAREEQDEMNRLASAKFDETELRTLAQKAKTPKVQEEARRRLAVIVMEENSYYAVKNDLVGLTEFVSKPCEACLVQGAARTQLKRLKEDQAAQAEMEILQTAKFDESELRTLARDAKTPKVKEEARRRLDVIATEESGYEAVKNDKAGLTEFLKKLCEACLVQGAARTQLQTLADREATSAASAAAASAARKERDEVNRLASVKFDESELRTLARGAKMPKVQEEARRRLDVIATEKIAMKPLKTT